MTEIVKESTGMNPKIKERIEQIRQGIVPEGYKKTRVGILPKEWTVKSLIEIAEVIDGDRSSNYPSGSDIKNEGVLFLSTKNIINGHFNFDEVRFISEEKFRSIKRGILQKKDLVITMRGSIGNVALFTGEKYSTGFINAQMSIIRPFSITSYFLWLTLNYHVLPRVIKRISSGSAQQQLRKTDIESLLIALPSTSKQHKIAKVLSAWDRAIELKEALIKEKEEQKKGLMQKVFSKIEEYSYVGELIKESKEVEENPEVERLLTVRLHLEGVFKRSLRGNETVGSTTLYRRKAGQFIYGKQNFHNGALGIVPEELDGYSSSSDIPSFDFVTEKVDPLYFYYYWSQKVNYKRMEAFTTGTGSKRLNPKEFYNRKMKLPSLQKQHSIAKALSMMDDKLNLLKKELSLLKEQKKGLMQLLLTGIVRVGEVEELE